MLALGLWGESFLAVRSDPSADVLVVEGWIGPDAMPMVMKEFHRGGYKLIVTGGCSTEGGWVGHRKTYADLAADELFRLGVPEEQLISAPAGGHVTRRTWSTAVAVRVALKERGVLPSAITVATRGCHARRSRLVFSRVFGGKVQIGVIPWLPEREVGRRWWNSSERTKDLLDETFSYAFERLFASGRWLTNEQSVDR